MFDNLNEQFKKDISNFVSKLEVRFEEFWQALIEELQTKKVALEDEVNSLNKTKEATKKEVEKLVAELTALKETKEKEKEDIEKLTEKEKTVLEKLGEHEKKIEEIVQRESLCDVRDKEQIEEQRRLKAKSINLEERERSVKKIMDRLIWAEL